MEEYHRIKKEHFKLFSLYHRWYTSPNSICRTLNTKYTSFRNASDKLTQKRALYKELCRLRHRRTLAWRRYRQRVRFNIFRLVFFKQTRKCPEFCRQRIEQYL